MVKKIDNNVENNKTNVFYVYEYYLIDTGDIFYVGKGTGRRAKSGIRNPEVERIKKENAENYGVRYIAENLEEQEAGDLEIKKIKEYRELGHPIANIKPGGANEKIDIDQLAIAKYLLFLSENNVLRITQGEISDITGVLPATVSELNNNEGIYSDIVHKVPDDIDEIIEEYNIHNYSEDDKKVGYVKYLLELIDKEVIKMNQRQLSDLYGINDTRISYIKLGKTHANIPAIVPENIGSILKEFDINIMSEKELKQGMLAFILRLMNEGFIKITSKELGEIICLSAYQVTEARRTGEGKKKKYVYSEVQPTPEIFGQLAPYLIVIKDERGNM